MEFSTVDPFSGEVLKTYRHFSLSEAQKETDQAWDDFVTWRKKSVYERAGALTKWAAALRACKDELAKTMTVEMGKPISQSLSEIDKSAASLEYLAEHGSQWIATKPVMMPKGSAEIGYEPLGVVLAIMPWNFPLWQTVRFAGPAILAGNTVILKHSDSTAGSAELIAKATEGMAGGRKLLRNVPMDHDTTAKLMSHPKIRGVTFTGSSRGGREVAESAARALKKTVLELGGSDAYVVLKDADLAKAAQVCAAARLVNGGQSCVAAKRFVVDRSVSEEFLTKFAAEMSAAQPADPRQKSTVLGPMASKKFQKQLAEQVEDLKRRGGKLLLGGELPTGPAAFYPPTIVLFERPARGLGDIEVFGPVAIVILADSEAQAIEIANDSVYGLAAAIFTRDLRKAKHLAPSLEAGFVAINDQVRSDVRLAFGGVKESGWGRELSPHGILEFCNIQSRTWSE